LFGVIDAAKACGKHVRAVLSLKLWFCGPGEIDRAALLRGALLPGVLQGPLQPACHCHSFFFILKIQPQNERGLDKFWSIRIQISIEQLFVIL
jgi:hypothetical protein